MKSKDIRLDHEVITELIEPRSSVLDLGCGAGELLYRLVKEKNVQGQGIEIDENAIYKCVAKGLNVFHGDVDSGLADFKDKAFDYVILNQSLQQVRGADKVLIDSLRVGKQVIVGFPNFAHLPARCQIFFRGKTPVTRALPYVWAETPNLHFFSIVDFTDYCRAQGIRIERKVFLGKKHRIHLFPNVFADTGIILISRASPHEAV